MKSFPMAYSYFSFENLRNYSRLHIFRRKLYYKYVIRKHFKNCEKVLDVGCGVGTFIEAAQKVGKDVFGIDVNSYCVAHCQAKDLDVECMSVYDMKFNEEYDAIFCSQFIEHIDEPFLAMEKMYKALKRDGRLFVITHCPSDKFWNEPTHVRPYTKKGLRRLFEWSSFRVLKVWYIRGTGNVCCIGEKIR